jgi:hypothetical protein
MRATLIVGAGPGGTGPLIWAAQAGKLSSWLARGVTVVDSTAVMGGSLGRYIINSDSLGAVYLECLTPRPAREIFGALLGEPVYRELDRLKHGYPPLALVDRYLRRVGSILNRVVVQHPGGEFLAGTTVRALHYRPDGTLVAELLSATGQSQRIETQTVILGLGGRHRAAWRNAQLAPGVRSSDVPVEKIVPTDTLMTEEGRQHAVALLASAARPRVVILGGSHRAFSVSWLLTHLMPEVRFGRGDIRILRRRDPPIFYESLAAAEADGYPATQADVCPRTQRVHRLGGIRGDGRDMWRRMTRRPGCAPEERVVMLRLGEPTLSPVELKRQLDEASLIVPAFGYQARTIPIFDARGQRVALRADLGRPAVDAQARIVRTDGQPLANVFCVGLGSGYHPTGSMGGEPSFAGQANSLWLYQNDIGGVVYQGVMRCLASSTRPRATAILSHLADFGARLKKGPDAPRTLLPVDLTPVVPVR